MAGVASADRGRHRGHWKNHHGGWSRPVYHSPRVVYSSPRVYAVRRPIYVQRPAIRYRYFNYYQRPAIIVENYPPRVGYYWVAGQWQWSGYEWIWQPGHYEPDPAYDQYNYNYAPAPTSGSVYYDGSYGY